MRQEQNDAAASNGGMTLATATHQGLVSYQDFSHINPKSVSSWRLARFAK